jgi:Ca2+-binding RTX toxin-like protein
MAKIKGTKDGDYLTGTNDDDTYMGLEGTDYFVSSKGDDTFVGTDSNDHTFSDDYVFYSDDNAGYSDPAGISVNLTTGKVIDGYGNRDTFVDIFNVSGSAHNDKIIGDDNDNELFGERGNDYLDGKGGFDFTWYGRATAGVKVDLEAGRATGGGGKDTVLNFEGVGGSNYSDKIYGSDEGGEWFSLDQFGDEGTPHNKQGADDYVDGRGGADGVFYSRQTAAIGVNLVSGAVDDGSGHTDTLVSIENIGGSQGSDIIAGSNGVNELNGEGGDDSIQGHRGNDILRGGAGRDGFAFQSHCGKDVIEDFSHADHDFISLVNFDTFGDFVDLKKHHLTEKNGNAVIDLGDGDRLTLIGIDADSLQKQDFQIFDIW